MFPVGARIGTYVVEDLLGEGGTSEVYLVERAGERFALKILKEEHRRNTALQARLINEAEALQRLDVDGVVQVFDAGDEAGRPFYVMERLRESLSVRLVRALPPAEAVRIIRKIARILSDLHARGVVHRDVKPSNLLFAADGSLRLADFGHAKLRADELPILPHSTETGAFVGTREYAAPEQLLNAKHVDGLADVYSLGLILFEALAGHRPFSAPTPEDLARLRLTASAPSVTSPLCTLSPQLVKLTGELLARRHIERPTAAEVYDRLGRIPLVQKPRRYRTAMRLAFPLLLVLPLGPQPPDFDSFDRVLAQGTVAEAGEVLEQLQSLGARRRERARLRQKTADLALAQGRLAEAAVGFRQAASEHAEDGNTRRQLSCKAQLAEALWHQGHGDEARALFYSALEDQPTLMVQKENRGDELPIAWLRLGLDALERKDFATARLYLWRVRKAPAGLVRQSRAEELLASIPGEPAALSLAEDALRHARNAVAAEPTSHRARLAKLRAELRLAILKADKTAHMATVGQLFALWQSDALRALLAHEFLEAAIAYLRSEETATAVREMADRVILVLDAHQQLADDVHVLRWKTELAALGSVRGVVLDR